MAALLRGPGCGPAGPGRSAPGRAGSSTPGGPRAPSLVLSLPLRKSKIGFASPFFSPPEGKMRSHLSRLVKARGWVTMGQQGFHYRVDFNWSLGAGWEWSVLISKGASAFGEESWSGSIRATLHPRCSQGVAMCHPPSCRAALWKPHKHTKNPHQTQSKPTTSKHPPNPRLLLPAAFSQSPLRKETPATRPRHIINSSIKKKKKKIKLKWTVVGF